MTRPDAGEPSGDRTSAPDAGEPSGEEHRRCE